MSSSRNVPRAVTPRVPEQMPDPKAIEERWRNQWHVDDIYKFEDPGDRSQVYSIDTPPPSVSGSLHVGTAFGFVHQDAFARFHRMSGRSVFYPIGWDDNGLPTERRVENVYGIRCDPSLHYDPDFQPPEKPDPKRKVPCSRKNFVELCTKLTEEDEKAYEDDFRRIGLSVDWSTLYTTISPEAQAISQLAFLRNVERNEAYQSEAPTFWDVTFQTAVAQAEHEDREVTGKYHRIVFTGPDGEAIEVDTTRPELLPACVALIVNPNDERFAGIVGKTARTPVFDIEIPIRAHDAADPDKGTGAVMCCTFGDNTDVIWWRELRLLVRTVMGRDGRFVAEAPVGFEGSAAESYSKMAGKTVFSAREVIVEMLRESGKLLEERPVTHAVKFYEKGDRPLEIVPSYQWYLKNGAFDEERRADMIKLGREMVWQPPMMRTRYEDWVQGLNGDWLVSRQRYFGVPFPVWYEADEDGESDRTKPIFASADQLPVDPSSDTPPGYDESQRNQPGGFVGDPDVMDTWATSSVTPHIAARWNGNDEGLFMSIFPMDMRPQGPEIIRTWLFDTVLRSRMEHNQLPWKMGYINGWILDPERKKMSKSKNNVVTPKQLVEDAGADGFRYWSCAARPGVDTAISVEQMKNGRRLAIKIMNVSRFVLGFADESVLYECNPTEFADLVQIERLRKTIDAATHSFGQSDAATALKATEEYFWDFCDRYVEMVKMRAYGNDDEVAAKSAKATLIASIGAIQRLFAPQLPFVTDETWSWWHSGSVHESPWPTLAEFAHIERVAEADAAVAAFDAVISAARAAKSAANVSMKYELGTVKVSASANEIELLRKAEQDIKNVSCIVDLQLVEKAEDGIEVEIVTPIESTKQ